MENYMEQAMEIAKAQAGVKPMTPVEFAEYVKETALELQKLMEGGETQVEETPEFVMDPKKAIKQKSITCVICGWKGKVLTKKHLSKHDMTPEEYKELCGYKKNTSLICKDLSKARKEKMAEMQIWKKVGKGGKTPTKPAEKK